MKPPSAEHVFSVSSETDRFWCAREVRSAARDLGFDEEAQWELAIVAAELVSNAVRYAGAGRLTVRAASGRRPGIEIVVADLGGAGWKVSGGGGPEATPAGPRPGLGFGLRTVQCLSHEVSIDRVSNGGTVVTAARYLEP